LRLAFTSQIDEMSNSVTCWVNDSFDDCILGGAEHAAPRRGICE
jgi:hypothetical protein